MAKEKTVVETNEQEMPIDFQEAIRKETVFRANVKSAQKGEFEDEEDSILLAFEGRKVTIVASEINIPSKQSLVTLVGSDIDFVILQAPEEVPLLIGSHKRAIEIIQKPIVDDIMSGKEMEAVITNILGFGAYLNIGGVTALMKNSDFSEDYNTIADVMHVGDRIKVKYVKTSSTGTIIMESVVKYNSGSPFSIDDFKTGQMVLGTIRSVKPECVFVNIAPRLDALAPVPQFADLQEGEKVQFQIKKVKADEGKVRGKIYRVLG